MGMFTRIPQDTFQAMELDAGVLLKDFNPANPAEPDDADIICATTGGINIVCQPTYSDLGEDVDNVPENMKELKKLNSWLCQMSFTSLDNSPEGIRLALGAADVTASTGKIKPRASLSQDDFTDVWWVGDRADGGIVAAKLKNALSTEGMSLQTTKNEKGQTSVTLTGHFSIDAQDDVPMEFYVLDSPTAEYEQATLTSAGFKYGVTYYTRTGSGTSQSPYVYTQVPAGSTYNSGTTYYVKA